MKQATTTSLLLVYSSFIMRIPLSSYPLPDHISLTLASALLSGVWLCFAFIVNNLYCISPQHLSYCASDLSLYAYARILSPML